MAQKGEDLDEAAKLSKQAFDITNTILKDPIALSAHGEPKVAAYYFKPKLDTYADSYAYILSKQGKFKEACAYEEPVYKDEEGDDAGVNENYAKILIGTGRVREARQVIEKAMKDGKSTRPMAALLKEAYIKTNGGDKGFEAYAAPIKSFYYQQTKTDYLKKMINKPAPVFALKDLQGNIVSLASLKGKVVVLDFWATWCAPCVASFPAMQMVVNKYKDNPNVKFLFIDIGESGPNYLAEVKRILTDNKCTFKVLEGGQPNEKSFGSAISASYGVEAIPARFIIDGNGHIRFKEIGFEGNAVGLAYQLSMMIELSTHPNNGNVLKL